MFTKTWARLLTWEREVAAALEEAYHLMELMIVRNNTKFKRVILCITNSLLVTESLLIRYWEENKLYEIIQNIKNMDQLAVALPMISHLCLKVNKVMLIKTFKIWNLTFQVRIHLLELKEKVCLINQQMKQFIQGLHLLKELIGPRKQNRV